MVKMHAFKFSLQIFRNVHVHVTYFSSTVVHVLICTCLEYFKCRNTSKQLATSFTNHCPTQHIEDEKYLPKIFHTGNDMDNLILTKPDMSYSNHILSSN